MRSILSLFLIFVLPPFANAQQISYPFPVKYITVSVEGAPVKMAYMDETPEKHNGRAVMLFHGKNFSGLYWESVMRQLKAEGFRVVAPDQVGWGKSAKPDAKYTFELLANNSKALLDTLGLSKIVLIGHSMGGMLAARFTLLYPQIVERLVLEDPLGMEDYKRFIPYTSMEKQYKKELAATYASMKKYQQTYYPVWKARYEQYVQAQAEPLKYKDYSTVAWVNALTYQMIFEQPVVYELKDIRVPVLIIVGALDRTIPGKDQLSAAKQKLYGNYSVLAKKTAKAIKGSKAVILPGIGHIPHVQDSSLFHKELMLFIR